MMADDLALQGPHPHLANGSRGRSNLLPYQPHGFTLTNNISKPHFTRVFLILVADVAYNMRASFSRVSCSYVASARRQLFLGTLEKILRRPCVTSRFHSVAMTADFCGEREPDVACGFAEQFLIESARLFQEPTAELQLHLSV